MREYANLPANFNSRINAFFLDLGIVALALLINIFMQYHTALKVGITLFVWLLVNILPLLFKKGQSLGKMNSKIKVVDLNNKDISFVKSSLRSLFILVFGFVTAGLYFVIGLYVSEQRINKRSIHDFVFKTKVVRTKVFVELTE